MDLLNKVAVVTGGNRGIGRAIVERLAEEGARIVFTYNKSADSAETLLRKLQDAGRKVLALQADANSFEKACEVISRTEEEFGNIDILINNAGITRDKSLMLMSPEEWRDVMDVNLTSVFNYSRAVIMNMFKQRSGNIINISSYSGVFGAAGQTNYSASKAGINGFTKALAKEVARYNIRVNAVAPGFIETEMLGTLSDKFKKDILKAVPLGRLGTPEEIAGTVIFLLSREAAYMTGQVVRIDGGLGI